MCFIGDSFVAGVGDPQCLGWVGRLAARTYANGRPATSYNLGVRRQILGRWQTECASRFPDGSDARSVVSFGVNDTTFIDGQLTV
ncbi:hypothetical protein ACQPXH_32585 [Nocardia sp. CA-135953]|uniref:hypothetical protein n=1 Tax=Nocardia sp. CA-135953 TaxID=3239978 RepID=UPI003D98D903